MKVDIHVRLFSGKVCVSTFDFKIIIERESDTDSGEDGDRLGYFIGRGV